MTTDELLAFIGPYAKATHPDKYAATLAVVNQAATFRRYLIRLIEIRWAEAPGDWQTDVPLSVLEESAIVATFRHRATGAEVCVKGRLAERPRVWTFGEMQALMDTPEAAMTFAQLIQLKQEFDLVHTET